jgi:hypothetical protein
MSSPNPDITASTIYKYVNGEVQDNVLTKTPFMNAVKKYGEIKKGVGGTRIQPPAIRTSGITPEAWTGRSLHQIPDPVMFTTIVFDWAGYITQYILLEWDKLENRPGDTRLFDRNKQVAKSIKADWGPFWETKVWLDGSSATPAGIIGVPGFMKATGTYGGLTQASAGTPWAPVRLAGTGISGKTYANDPIAYICNVRNTMAIRGAGTGLTMDGDNSVKAFTTQVMWEHLRSFHQAQSFSPVTVKTDDVGFNFMNIVECNTPIYWSPNATSAQMNFFDFEEFTLWFQTDDMLEVRVSESIQPIGQITQLYTKTSLTYGNPWKAGQIHTSGVS